MIFQKYAFFSGLLLALGPLSTFAAGAFVELQWGLKNLGDPQSIELDHVTNYKVQGRKGQDVNLPSPLLKPSKKVLVAVLDTGVDTTHPALASIIHRNESECLALEKYKACIKDSSQEACDKIWLNLNNPEVDQDHNGYPMDCSGWSILGKTNSIGIRGTPDFTDELGHGTHVAGIIGAKGETLGVSSAVEILPVQVLGQKPSEPLKPLSVDISPGEAGKEKYSSSLGDLVARGVNYAIASHAQVINFSLGWPETNDSEYLRSVIAEAQARGIIIVAAAGNDSTRALLRPCAYPGVICVASHGPDGSLSHFSNYGTGVDIAAPGTNILSTYPMDIRPVRFRSTQGYEYLNGTSQATPFVSGLVADMLARGIPANEIYPRLILGSRKIQAKLPLLSGPIGSLQEDANSRRQDPRVETKFLLGGLADLSQSLKVAPQSFIVPVSKEKQEVAWDRKSNHLQLKFAFKNLWKEADFSQVSMKLSFLKPDARAIRPQIDSYSWSSVEPVWPSGEERILTVELSLTDSKVPGESRIPSDLDLAVELTTEGVTRRLVLESEVIVSLGTDMGLDPEIQEIKVEAQGRMSWLYVDEKLDGESKHDYLGRSQEENQLVYQLLRQEKNLPSSPYKVQGTLKINIANNEDDIEEVREQVLVRMSKAAAFQYGLALLFDRSEKEDADSALRIYLLDKNLQVLENLEVTTKTNQLPQRLFWQKDKLLRRPTWVGMGYDPAKKPTLRDDWENPDHEEKPDFRLYYFDAQKKLKSLSLYQGYKIIDILEPSLAQVERGAVPVLLAKNRGNDNKSSYIYDFAVSEVYDGEFHGLQVLNLFLDRRIYRNLLDTRVDKVFSLEFEPSTTKGTFWFGEGGNRTQRVSLLIPNQDFTDFKFFDQSLAALSGTVDSTLWVRSASYSSNRVGVFAFTNSQLQYHDLTRKQVATSSLERYTFWADYLFTSIHFPIVMQDRSNPTTKIPALYTTESSGISKGVRIKSPYYDPETGDLIEINSPARLRLRSERGCKPLNAPLFDGKNGAASFDYFCGDKILRVPLRL
jgi:hypothetical protein